MCWIWKIQLQANDLCYCTNFVFAFCILKTSWTKLQPVQLNDINEKMADIIPSSDSNLLTVTLIKIVETTIINSHQAKRIIILNKPRVRQLKLKTRLSQHFKRNSDSQNKLRTNCPEEFNLRTAWTNRFTATYKFSGH